MSSLKISILCLVGATLVQLAGCGSEDEIQKVSRAVALDREREACFDKGLNYFMDIGSYPTLKSAPNEGRLATDVIKERCARTVNAFGELSIRR